ncbi:hypothetical protein BCEN4_740022 [Burkholderia cenocepacia]|nr:hypothetical protein BCEN4_740022 [Burkholderia cenocepacia]
MLGLHTRRRRRGRRGITNHFNKEDNYEPPKTIQQQASNHSDYGSYHSHHELHWAHLGR